MEFVNRPAAPIAWRPHDFVAYDVPMARPWHYTSAVRITHEFLNRLRGG